MQGTRFNYLKIYKFKKCFILCLECLNLMPKYLQDACFSLFVNLEYESYFVKIYGEQGFVIYSNFHISHFSKILLCGYGCLNFEAKLFYRMQV